MTPRKQDHLGHKTTRGQEASRPYATAGYEAGISPDDPSSYMTAPQGPPFWGAGDGTATQGLGPSSR